MIEPSTPLEEYRRKRDFGRTPEPEGKHRGTDAGGRRFVVQKHAARRLHYDFRLELEGGLKSWAVPKGPSLDPEVRALAVQVEDHPLEYADFEGIIPAGEYGGGTVMVWDRGRWFPDGDPVRGLAKGHLAFRLEGRKLRGRWDLVRMKDESSGDAANWLLRKRRDREARPESEWRVVDEAPLSVSSGRTLEEIQAAADRVWRSAPGPPAAPAGSPELELPPRVLPQLPTLVRNAPEGNDWLHELKLDGYRLLARVEDDRTRLVTRRGFDWTDRFASLAEAVKELDVPGSILDGEAAVPSRDGTTDFQALQNELGRGRDDAIRYYLFDIPFYRGHDLRELPLLERKELLRALLEPLGSSDTLRFSDHIRGSGPEVFRGACRRRVEGIVSKRVDAPYREGRGKSWVKLKCVERNEFVVGGWTDPGGGRQGFGALLLGWYERKGELRYVGRVGTGFTERALGEIRERLHELAAEHPPFRNPPTGAEARGVHWVEPELVAVVDFGSWTEEGLLRHAAFRGLREDKHPREVKREMPDRRRKETTAGATRGNTVAGVRLTNAGRVLYPEQGLTKRDLARYYEAVADRILPHVVDRPLTLVRCPQGREGSCFYQKHLTEGFPEPVRGIEVEEEDGSELYVAVDDLAGLVTLIQFGVLEIHPWGSRGDRLDRPDRLVFDLDPGEGVGWSEVVRAGLELRDRLDGLGLTSFPRVTGGKGLHLVVPIERRTGWDRAKAFTRAVARRMARDDRARFVATASKAERKGRIYVDYLRNGRGATAVASWSTRARWGAPVAAPIRWEELAELPGADAFRVAEIGEDPDRLRADPWEGFHEVRQSITKEMMEQA